jgi:dihydrofolate synthase/folylpolyglutamate synthase
MNQGHALGQPHVREGLARHTWPGRLEKVCDAPLMILDGAHNRAAAQQLARFLKNRMNGRNVTLVVGILDDKPYEYMLSQWLPACHRVIITKPDINRALPPETLAAAARKYISEPEIYPNVAEALRHARDTTARKEAICIAGSLYVVGEARAEIALWENISLTG